MVLDERLMEFVRKPNVAILATLRANGSPHQTAVWYVFQGGEVKITITDGRAKYRHVMRDPRVSLAIASPTAPYKEVVFEGKAMVDDEGGHDLFRQLAVRYYGDVDGNAYADYSRDIAKDNRLVLHFTPERTLSWDFGVEDDYHHPWQPGFDPLVRASTPE